MFIPNEQLEKESTPLAYRITIRLIGFRSASEKNSLEKHPDQEQRKAIKETIEEIIGISSDGLLALNVNKRKLEFIVETPAETKKIINRLIISIIEILKKSERFSEKVNLWQPETKTQNIWTKSELESAIRSVKNEKELALRRNA